MAILRGHQRRKGPAKVSRARCLPTHHMCDFNEVVWGRHLTSLHAVPLRASYIPDLSLGIAQGLIASIEVKILVLRILSDFFLYECINSMIADLEYFCGGEIIEYNDREIPPSQTKVRPKRTCRLHKPPFRVPTSLEPNCKRSLQD